MKDQPPRSPAAAPSTESIRGWSLGPFDTNCYIITGRGSKACWIVDPGIGPGKVIQVVKKEGLVPEAIVLTHAHLDHVAGVPEVLRAFPGLPIIGHETERDWPGDPNLNLSAPFGLPISVPGATRFVAEGDVLRLGEDEWRVIHTPGHSPGGITLYRPRAGNCASGEHGKAGEHGEDGGAAIVGDTLFAASIGRSDFPGSDEATLHASIRERLYTLPDATVVFPGHGPKTTIAQEKRTNPYVQATK